MGKEEQQALKKAFHLWNLESFSPAVIFCHKSNNQGVTHGLLVLFHLSYIYLARPNSSAASIGDSLDKLYQLFFLSLINFKMSGLQHDVWELSTLLKIAEIEKYWSIQFIQ